VLIFALLFWLPLLSQNDTRSLPGSLTENLLNWIGYYTSGQNSSFRLPLTGGAQSIPTTFRATHTMSKGNNFYKVLGVSRTASQAQIKKAYHKKSRDHHTDKHGSGATEKMQQINHAHEIFSDPESRKRYDMTGEDPSIRQPRNK
jgi:hypothetical protein